MKTLTAAAITLCAIATASLADDRETSCRYQVAAAVQKARLDGVSEAGVADAIAATNPGWPAQYNNAIPQLTAYVYQLKKRDLRKIDLGTTLREQCIEQWDQIQAMQKQLKN